MSDILKKASDGTTGYDTTTNGGGEYKVWVSSVSTFDNNSSKTDNFKVKDQSVVDTGTLLVQKFYDANANGPARPGSSNKDRVFFMACRDAAHTRYIMRCIPVDRTNAYPERARPLINHPQPGQR